MLIFLASVAFLLMLLAIGERAGAHMWHGGSHRSASVSNGKRTVRIDRAG